MIATRRNIVWQAPFCMAALWAVAVSIYIAVTPFGTGMSTVIDSSGRIVSQTISEPSFYESEGLWGLAALSVFPLLYISVALSAFFRRTILMVFSSFMAGGLTFVAGFYRFYGSCAARSSAMRRQIRMTIEGAPMKTRHLRFVLELSIPSLALLLFVTACADEGSQTEETQPQRTQPQTQRQEPGARGSTADVTGRAADPIAAADCTPPAPPTPSSAEGPYFKAGSPERQSLLEPGVEGTALTITGYVLTTDCKPLANALLDFWQADAAGVYDNDGYRLRGHQFTDSQGRYLLKTVAPGQYAGRTQHIHVKIRPAGGPVLTTQLFFPESPGNLSDAIFDGRLLLDIRESAAETTAQFNFIIQTA